ncbi:unnamed protein product [Cercopithifilaria johnstoni]|uniref:Uncharacterized protein n=1 Tax=Cercopithifilaria johnstoni TaxID=2874296 RepID=A0A8J2MA59_9BILA|nr:unnamed protein product [Cercopithifilaria johnstoni]
MISLGIGKLPWRYRQLLLVLLLAISICYAIPMNKDYDPFIMDNEFYAKREIGLISGDANVDDISISNITALARSKRNCCGCCCCCCCWHVFI